MTLFFAGSRLSKGDLALRLRNEFGYPKDAVNVRWTISSLNGGKVSGNKLPAIKLTAGEYYAPWLVVKKNGNYKIEWEYQERSGGPTVLEEQQFFVINPSSYQCANEICQDGTPDSNGLTFLTGTVVGKNGLTLFLKNGEGLPEDAAAVFWTILDVLDRPVTIRAHAGMGDTGEYFAPWVVDANTGNYSIFWEYKETESSPLTATRQKFCVINPQRVCDILTPECATSVTVSASCCPKPCPPTLFSPIICPPPTPPIEPVPVVDKCCPFETERIVHLPRQILPFQGDFTDQKVFLVPTQVRRITFYIEYTRGGTDGYAIYRLLWGNGIEETQSTLIQDEFAQLSTAMSSQDMFINDLTGPQPVDNNKVAFLLETTVPGGAKTVRLLAAERGNCNSPGTTFITLTAASE